MGKLDYIPEGQINIFDFVEEVKPIRNPGTGAVFRLLRYGEHTMVPEVVEDCRRYIESIGGVGNIPVTPTYDFSKAWDGFPCENCEHFDGNVCRYGAHTVHYEYEKFLVCDAFRQTIDARKPIEKEKKEIKNCEHCDCQSGSLICFERRGYFYDYAHRDWILRENGQKLRRTYNERECTLDWEYVDDIANGIKKWCEEWNYDHSQKLYESPTVDTFFKTICKLTKCHFFYIGDDLYGIEYNKKSGTGAPYKCGKDNDCCQPLCDVPIENIIAKLIPLERMIEFKENGK